MMNSNSFAVIITAAGSSTRMGGDVKKEYLPLNDGTVLSTCVKAFVDASRDPRNDFNLSNLIITIPVDGTDAASAAMAAFYQFDSKIQEIVDYVPGGHTRHRSIYNALEHLSKKKNLPDYVLIHDGARPFVSQNIISYVIQGTKEFGAAAPGITPTDTQKEIDESGFIKRHLLRKDLVSIQTPQGFKFAELFAAHQKAFCDGHEYTDDTEIWGNYCGRVKVVTGSNKNIKITYPGDLEKGLKN
ncbi:MAG: 2-C-methyl-D-erythritol 4-phosphate cytidylyltransferase [Treponema sp.]|nr:2-C-methyl-D-erythritol 4-phosphate cytidylyltransferase [Treponema sp.]